MIEYNLDIDFSIIIPTRRRINLLENLLRSIFEKSGNILKTEIILICDYDDLDTIKYLESFKWIVPSNFRYCISPLLKIGTVKLYNAAAQIATRGKYIWCLNDDTELVIDNWDIKGQKAIEEFLLDKKDRIFYGRVNDDWNENRCCFPIISKEFRDVLGWVLPPSVIAWPADHALGYIFGYEGWPGGKSETPIIREVDLTPLVGVSHISQYNHKRGEDETSLRVRELYQWTPVDSIKDELNEAVRKLNDYINSFKA